MYKCKKCGKEFDKKHSLAAHYSSAHSKKSRKRKINIVIKQCKKCGEDFEVERKVYKNKGEFIPQKEKEYCSRSCANSRNLTEEHRAKISKAITGKVVYSTKKFYHEECSHCGKELQKRYSDNEYAFCCREHTNIFKMNINIQKAKKSGWVEVTTKPSTVKKYYLHERGHQCEICKETEWIGKPIPLVLDHIDGNSDNWDYNNLRLVCRNCDGLLPTFAGRNKGSNKHQTKRMKEQDERIKNGKQQYRKVV